MLRRNWLITGVSSGFGRIMTEHLLAHGDRVAGTVRDPKMVERMIASVDQEPAPRRIALGGDAYQVMHRQLSVRLEALEAQRALASSADFPAEEGVGNTPPWFALEDHNEVAGTGRSNGCPLFKN